MGIISSAQIRAARALLGWSQDDLASRVKLTKASISKIEKGINAGKRSTLELISSTFDNAGIAFDDNDGVRRKGTLVRVLKGREGFISFFDDVYETVKIMGGEICINNVNEREFDRWLGNYARTHMTRMQSLRNYRLRALVRKGDAYAPASEYAIYHSISESLFSNVPFYIYGDKMGIVLFQADDVNIIQIQDAAAVQAQRLLFDTLWGQSYPVEESEVRS